MEQQTAQLDWLARSDELIEDAFGAEPSTTGLLFPDAVAREQQRIHDEVAEFARVRPVEKVIAQYHTGDHAFERYVTHAAMLGFLASREVGDGETLQDVYFRQIWEEAGVIINGPEDMYRAQVITFHGKDTKGPAQNWYLRVPDPTWGDSPITHKFLYQLGEDKATWSYKMKTIAGLH